MIEAGTGVHDAVVAHVGAGIDDGPRHDNCALTNFGTRSDHCAGMDECDETQVGALRSQPFDDRFPRVVIADRDAPARGFMAASGLCDIMKYWNAIDTALRPVVVDKGDHVAARASGNVGDDACVLTGTEQNDLRAASCHRWGNCHTKTAAQVPALRAEDTSQRTGRVELR